MRSVLIQNDLQLKMAPLKLFVGTQINIREQINQVNDEGCLKEDLLKTQSELSLYDPLKWASHTHTYSITRNVVDLLKKDLGCSRLVTKAWLKFYEILVCYPLVKDIRVCFTSLHLCESPGAFIYALSHFISNKFGRKAESLWHWKATSLNPHYEYHRDDCALVDDVLVLRSKPNNWLFGLDNIGDITCAETRNALGYKFDLVTADGGINCEKRPSDQETMTLPLIASEIDVALANLKIGGSLVLKIFTVFEHETYLQIKRLIAHFHEIHMVKPTCSGFGNSERYLVCVGYREYPIVEESINHQNLLNATGQFVKNQMVSIRRNISIWNDKNYVDRDELVLAQKYFALGFLAYLGLNNPKICSLTAILAKDIIDFDKRRSMLKDVLNDKIDTFVRYKLHLLENHENIDYHRFVQPVHPQVTLMCKPKFSTIQDYDDEDESGLELSLSGIQLKDFLRVFRYRSKLKNENPDMILSCGIGCDLWRPFPTTSPFLDPSVLLLFRRIIEMRGGFDEKIGTGVEHNAPNSGAMHLEWNWKKSIVVLFVPNLLRKEAVEIVFYLSNCCRGEVSANLCCTRMCGCLITFNGFVPDTSDRPSKIDPRTIFAKRNHDFLEFIQKVNLLCLQNRI